jgi:hypothetical protein
LIPNALCSCGKSDEPAIHFLLHCKNYIVQRNIYNMGLKMNYPLSHTDVNKKKKRKRKEKKEQ